MKNILTILLIFSLLPAQAQTGIAFQSLNWEQAKAKAKAEDKLIFIDFYATWCGPCKYLEKDIFTQAEVGEYYNSNFINLRLDAEKEELDLVEFINLEAYPTLVIFDAEGNILSKNVGAVEAPELIAFAHKAGDYPKALAEYEASPNNNVKIDNYLGYIVENEPDKANEIALNYLERLDEEDLLGEESWTILKYLNDYNSPIVTYVYNNLQKTSGSLNSNLEELTYALVNESLKDAVELQDLEILGICKDIEMKYRKATSTLDEPAAYYDLETDLLYYKYTDNLPQYTKLLDQQTRTYFWDEAEYLAANAMDLCESYYSEDAALGIRSLALEWIIRSRVIEDTSWISYYSEALVYYYFDEYKLGLPLANKAMDLMDDDDIDFQPQVFALIDELETGQ